jgi:hypothetical protein
MTALLPIPQLPEEAKIVHLFPALGETSLISIGQLCDAGCKAIFDATTAKIYYQDSLVLQGSRSSESSGLWTLRITDAHSSNHAVNMQAKPEDLVDFAHRSLFSPANSTLLRALQLNFLPPFPGLTIQNLRKFPPRSEATIKGHLDAARKNYKSTHKSPAELLDPLLRELLDDAFPPSNTEGTRTHHVFAALHETKAMIHSDLTG